MVRNFRELLHNIRAFAFDVDGVCTNNKVLISESGLLLRNSNTKDGYAIHAAVRNNFPVAIITGGRTESVASRWVLQTSLWLYPIKPLRSTNF